MSTLLELSPQVLAEIAERFKALGEPARLQLVRALQGGERTVGELVEETGLGQANASKHLQQLTAAGFLHRRKEGTYAYYSLADADVLALCDVMCGRIEAERGRRAAVLGGQAAPVRVGATRTRV